MPLNHGPNIGVVQHRCSALLGALHGDIDHGLHSGAVPSEPVDRASVAAADSAVL
jgi:hypothetical protein